MPAMSAMPAFWLRLHRVESDWLEKLEKVD
jgi:hypothetical protein